MKALATIFMALVIAGCAGTADYVHSTETHREAVSHKLRTDIKPAISAPVMVYFRVMPDGKISFIGSTGGTRHDRAIVTRRVERAAPFPQHRHESGYLPYWVWFVPEGMEAPAASERPE